LNHVAHRFRAPLLNAQPQVASCPGERRAAAAFPRLVADQQREVFEIATRRSIVAAATRSAAAAAILSVRRDSDCSAVSVELVKQVASS
jgi:hypothetical protein